MAGSEPLAGAQHAAVQRLQYFLSQSTWDADEVNRRRLELLVNAAATAPHGRGVIAIDDSGDRKDGTRTAHVARQWLGRYGKTDNGAAGCACRLTHQPASTAVAAHAHPASRISPWAPRTAATGPETEPDEDETAAVMEAIDDAATAFAALADVSSADMDDFERGVRQLRRILLTRNT